MLRYLTGLLLLLVGASPQFVLDVLSPYEEDNHGSRHRTVRSVAECQSEGWGNDTMDVYHLKIPVPKSAQYDVHRFADKVESNLQNIYSVHRRRYLLGSIGFFAEPYYKMSVLEPLKPGGCQVHQYYGSKATVTNTAQNRMSGCKVAVNAGYFNVRNRHCLGNVVADGRVVQVSEEMNANFGIRQDGSVVVGYIPPEEVKEGSFRQLISGVIWLVRNGSNYVNESMNLECASNQNTGKMSTFVNVLSARTALGLDAQGRIVVAQIDGQTHVRGANLFEFADLLIRHGVVSAINLDGGGSSTFVYKDVIINYPSDHCAHAEYRCERQVSTIICFHDVQCLEPSCNHHGNCTNGQCSCFPPWMGLDCSQLNCSTENCSGHGHCSNGVCTCDAGWKGERCGKECPAGTFGSGCSRCRCYGRSLCDRYTGHCYCPPGYIGYRCWQQCPSGFYGDKCTSRCPAHNCSDHGSCSRVDGSCVCAHNWTGTTCNETYYVTTTTNIPSETTSTSDPLPKPSVNQHQSPTDQSPMDHSQGDQSKPAYMEPHCNTSNLSTTASSSWFYRYFTIAVVAALAISVFIHILVCMKLRRTRTKRIHLNTLLSRKKRRRKRKRTEVPQFSSSSDCSI